MGQSKQANESPTRIASGGSGHTRTGVVRGWLMVLLIHAAFIDCVPSLVEHIDGFKRRPSKYLNKLDIQILDMAVHS